MGMNFRETTALLREAESRDNLAAALKGGKVAKEFREERESLEKAAGGKKKLEQADKVLADAEKISARLVAEARSASKPILLAANKVLEKAKVERDQIKIGILDSQHDLEVSKRALVVKEQELQDLSKTLDAREKVADERSEALDTFDATLNRREAQATGRETEIKRFKDWRATAPA